MVFSRDAPQVRSEAFQIECCTRGFVGDIWSVAAAANAIDLSRPGEPWSRFYVIGLIADCNLFSNPCLRLSCSKSSAQLNQKRKQASYHHDYAYMRQDWRSSASTDAQCTDYKLSCSHQRLYYYSVISETSLNTNATKNVSEIRLHNALMSDFMSQ